MPAVAHLAGIEARCHPADAQHAYLGRQMCVDLVQHAVMQQQLEGYNLAQRAHALVCSGRTRPADLQCE